ncbi:MULTISPECIES: STAS domain-containing protein [Novilysobacter]|uniref:STAS domain-containing protein n=1 Tax=Novilysobacter TaxID=3382699 RepID=UPI002EDA1DFB
MTATVNRTADTLGFTGALDRSASPALWKQAQPLLAGVAQIDLHAVSAVDSAGLALLAEIAAHCEGARVVGAPAGLAELRAAYRLDDRLAFAG